MDTLWNLLGTTPTDASAALAWRGDPGLSTLYSVFLFLVGACLASFSGLVADRLPGIMGWDPEDPRGLNSPSSHCEGCGAAISPLALIPILGWILCRGRCPHCSHRVPVIYPIVEAAVGAASVAIPVILDGSAVALPILVLFWSCVALIWCDLRHHVLPFAITIPILMVGLAFAPLGVAPSDRIVGVILGAAATWMSFALVSRMRDEDAMSGGDVMLAAAAGAWLGHQVGAFLALSCALFLLQAIPLRARGVEWVPFGPALCASLVVCTIAYPWLATA